MDDDIVTEDQCKRILKKYIEELNQKERTQKLIEEIEEDSDKQHDVTLTSFKTSPLSPQPDGLIGEQFYLTLNYRKDEKIQKAQFFVKIISQGNPLMYVIAKEIGAFDKETFFYNTFVPYLKEEGFSCDYAVKGYLYEADTIVLQDLSLLSYKTPAKYRLLDLEHCKVCLETIAKIHTDLLLFELHKSKDLDWEYLLSEAFPEIFDDQRYTINNENSITYYKHAITGLCQLISALPETVIKAEHFRRAFIDAVQKIPKLNTSLAYDFKTTLCHNDLFSSNILYKYDQNGDILDCKIVDFQSISLKPPIYDVLGFLYRNTRKSFRDEHIKDLLKYYYNYFSQLIQQKGYAPEEVLSEEEFMTSYEALKIIIKSQAVIDRSFYLIPEEVYAENLKNDNKFSKFVFEDRGTVMLGLFKNDSNYREYMTEELCELRTMLFHK